MATMTKQTDATDAEVAAAYREYDAAYRDYEAATRMNVSTPEGCGTFGGVWDCDQGRLLRALVLAIRRTAGACSAAAEKVARGEAVRVGRNDYGDIAADGSDVYRTPNGMLRDSDGRYLTGTEVGIVARIDAGPHNAHYYTAGALTQRWIDEQAGDQVARTLTKPYLSGWPACRNVDKVNACRRVRDLYRTLTAAFADAT